MRPIWFFYVLLGMILIFCVYMTTLGSMEWWYMVYYIGLGFLGVLGIFYPQSRWPFIVGMLLGVILLFMLYKYGVLYHESRFPLLDRFIY
jgi:hypothetical protein